MPHPPPGAVQLRFGSKGWVLCLIAMLAPQPPGSLPRPPPGCMIVPWVTGLLLARAPEPIQVAEGAVHTVTLNFNFSSLHLPSFKLPAARSLDSLSGIWLEGSGGRWRDPVRIHARQQ